MHYKIEHLLAYLEIVIFADKAETNKETELINAYVSFTFDLQEKANPNVNPVVLIEGCIVFSKLLFDYHNNKLSPYEIYIVAAILNKIVRAKSELSRISSNEIKIMWLLVTLVKH